MTTREPLHEDHHRERHAHHAQPAGSHHDHPDGRSGIGCHDHHDHHDRCGDRGRGHSHHHHGHPHHDFRENNKKALVIALCITGGIMLLEFFGGLVTNSLALLSDSGHMLGDAGSLLLSLIAFRLAARPASARKTYGFHRVEILAALANGAALFLVAGVIIWEAVERLFNPPAVQSGAMMGIAAVGLAANLLSAFVLMRKGDVHGNLNLRGAFLHVVSDALGSVGAILAGGFMLAFGWYVADPLISMLVAVLILRSAWGVLSHSVHVLMEGTPHGIERQDIIESLRRISGVEDVHDVHCWTITSGMNAFSCHLLIRDDADSQDVLQQAIGIMSGRFGIDHATIQVETERIRHLELHD